MSDELNRIPKREIDGIISDGKFANEHISSHYQNLIEKVSNKFHDLCEKRGLEPSSSEADQLFEQVLNEVPGAEEAYETWGNLFDGTL